MEVDAGKSVGVWALGGRCVGIELSRGGQGLLGKSKCDDEMEVWVRVSRGNWSVSG